MNGHFAASIFDHGAKRCLYAVLGIVTFSTLVIGLLLAPNAVWSKAPETVPAIKFQQLHRFFGRLELTISKIGVKIVCHDSMSFNLVAKAPLWNVTVYREDDKTFFQETLHTFLETGLVSGLILSFHERNTSIIQKHPGTAQVYGFPVVKLGGGHHIFEYMELGKDYPATVSDIVWCAYKQPTNGGIPIYLTSLGTGKDMITGMDETGHVETQITTFSIKHLAVPPTFFDPPTGYRKVKSLSEVVLSANKRNESQEFQIIMDQPKSIPLPKH